MLLFFVPEAKAVSAELLKRNGLDLLEHKTTARETFSGPGGKQGLLIARNDTPAELLQFNSDKQAWSPRFGSTSLVGTWHDHPVVPASLVRPNPVLGPQLRLLDGNLWTIPLLRQWKPGDAQQPLAANCKLPRVVQQSPIDGRFILGEVVPEYSGLWARSLNIAQQVLQQAIGEPVEMDDHEVNQFACDLLAVNYRLDSSVISHLRLLTPGLLGEIVCAALDIGTLRAHLKNLLSRRTSVGTNTESGETLPSTDSTTPTARRRRK